VEEKRKFEKKKKEQKRAAATARENHEKAVNGRENRNCHKFCNLYRVATDSTSTPERAKTVKKQMCFAEPKAEDTTQSAKEAADEKEVKEEKAEREAQEQREKDREVQRNSESDEDSKKPKAPALFRELGETAAPSCTGMECTCVVYTSYEGSDDMDSIDNSGVIGKRR